MKIYLRICLSRIIINWRVDKNFLYAWKILIFFVFPPLTYQFLLFYAVVFVVHSTFLFYLQSFSKRVINLCPFWRRWNAFFVVDIMRELFLLYRLFLVVLFILVTSYIREFQINILRIEDAAKHEFLYTHILS